MTFFDCSLFTIRPEHDNVFFFLKKLRIWHVKNMSTAGDANAKSRLGFKCIFECCSEGDFLSANFSIKSFCALPVSKAAATPPLRSVSTVSEVIIKPFRKTSCEIRFSSDFRQSVGIEFQIFH